MAADFEIAAQAEVLRHEILRACSHPLLDVVAGDHEVLPVVRAAAQDDVDVRVVGVPVIDADPIELRAEVLFHLAHEIAGEVPQIGHAPGVFG